MKMTIEKDGKQFKYDLLFIDGDEVFIVKKKRKKVVIYKDEITSFAFTNMMNYHTMHNGCFDDDSAVFRTESDAMEYARSIAYRIKVKRYY